MTVAIDDLPPLIWHAELGDKLPDCGRGTHHRGVQLNDLRQAVERWMLTYDQRCWLRQLTPYATREQEDGAAAGDRPHGRHRVPDDARLTGRWMRGRCPSATSPAGFRSSTARCAIRRAQEEGKLKVGVETAYCAETVAITFEEMGLLTTEKQYNSVRSGQVLER